MSELATGTCGGLLVEAAGEQFILPRACLEELVTLSGAEVRASIERIHGWPVLSRRGRLVPLVVLTTLLELPASDPAETVHIAIVNGGRHLFGLYVDRFGEPIDVPVRPVCEPAEAISAFAAVATMADGALALVLDVPGIADAAGVWSAALAVERRSPPVDAAVPELVDRRSAVIVRAGTCGHLAIELPTVAHLETFTRANVERGADGAVVHERGRDLRLVDLPELLGGQRNDRDRLPVVVVDHGGRSAGLVVDEIIDLVCAPVTRWRPSGGGMLAGSGILAGTMTDFLDVRELLDAVLGPLPLPDAIALDGATGR